MAIIEFSFKFVDIMLGVILGLGFQWWPNMTERWQYVAFVFVYLNLIDYWIDYTPALKKFPMKREIDVLIHTAIIFAMFFSVYSTQKTIPWFFGAYIFYRLSDLLWIWRMYAEKRTSDRERKFMSTWAASDAFEAFVSFVLIILYTGGVGTPLTLLVVFIILRLLSRIVASINYRQVYYTDSKGR